jgi:hypothetical protein
MHDLSRQRNNLSHHHHLLSTGCTGTYVPVKKKDLFELSLVKSCRVSVSPTCTAISKKGIQILMTDDGRNARTKNELVYLKNFRKLAAFYGRMNKIDSKV